MNFEPDWRMADVAAGLEENRITEARAGDKLICLLRREGKLFAFAARCPHASGRFCEGWVDASGNLVCPEHKYRFSPRNGYNTSGEGYKLKTFPVKEADGHIFVQC